MLAAGLVVDTVLGTVLVPLPRLVIPLELTRPAETAPDGTLVLAAWDPEAARLDDELAEEVTSSSTMKVLMPVLAFKVLT